MVCSGSLISSKTVITGAVCVSIDRNTLIPKRKVKLLFGSVDLKRLSGTEALRIVDNIISHLDYQNHPMINNDIALIIIKGALQFSDTISPVCLFESSITREDVGKTFIVLGFKSDHTDTITDFRYLNNAPMTVITYQSKSMH